MLLEYTELSKLNNESLIILEELKELHKNPNIFKYYNCVCGSKNNDELIAIKDRYGLDCNFVICKNCGLIRMNPYYTEKFSIDFYSRFYSPIYRGGKTCSLDLFNRMCNIRGKYIIERIRNSINIDLSKAKIFEVATGSGGILKAFKDEGSEVYGCDYDEDFMDHIKINTPYGNLYMTHKPLLNPNIIKENDIKILINGHTHVPQIKKVEDLYILNPGSVAYPRLGNSPSYMIINIEKDKIDAKIIYF